MISVFMMAKLFTIDTQTAYYATSLPEWWKHYRVE